MEEHRKQTAREFVLNQQSKRRNSKQRQKVPLDDFENPLNQEEIKQFLKYKQVDNVEIIEDPTLIKPVNKPSALNTESIKPFPFTKHQNANMRSGKGQWMQLTNEEKKFVQRNEPIQKQPEPTKQEEEEPTFIPVSIQNQSSDLENNQAETDNNQTKDEQQEQSKIQTSDSTVSSVESQSNVSSFKPMLLIESIIDERAPNVHYPKSMEKPHIQLPENAKRCNKGYGAKFTSKPVLEKFSYVKNLKSFRFNMIPNGFDWRTKTSSNGAPFLSETRDQGSCGSCYAFATLTAFEPRIRIATDGAISENLSPQDMVNCGPSFVKNILENPSKQPYLNTLYQNGTLADATWFALEGCNGGLLAAAANYVVLQGSPKESVVPYTGNDGKCLDGLKRFKGFKAVDLVEGIEEGFPPYTVNLPSQVLQQNILNMQMAIMNDGPIVTGLNIYTDFLYYPQISEVYSTVSSFVIGSTTVQTKYEGAHAVAVVGWGETVDGNGQPLPYWICQNSWGKGFGFDGFFYIRRGVNMANIELYAAAIFPDTPSYFASSGQGIEASFSLGGDNFKQSDTIAGIAWYWWIVIAFAIAIVLVIVITVSVVFTKKNQEARFQEEARRRNATLEQPTIRTLYDIQ